MRKLPGFIKIMFVTMIIFTTSAFGTLAFADTDENIMVNPKLHMIILVVALIALGLTLFISNKFDK